MPTPSLTHTAVTVCPQTIIQLRVEGTKQCVSRQVIDANLPDPNGYVTKDLLNAALKSGVADGIFLQYKQSWEIPSRTSGTEATGGLSMGVTH